MICIKVTMRIEARWRKKRRIAVADPPKIKVPPTTTASDRLKKIGLAHFEKAPPT